jgi:hypothetical protein
MNSPLVKRTLMVVLAVSLTIILLLIEAERAEAFTLTTDPGAVGTSYFYNDFHFVGALNGTVLNGQTEAVDIVFSSNKFAVAGKFGIDLWINQSDGMGVWPTSYSSVTGSLLGATGNPLSGPINFTHMGTVPTQIWPGWGYYLPDGTEYLPAATGYSTYFPGTPINIQPDGSYYLDPIFFSGVHFDITYPVTPTSTVMGLRMVLYNYSDYSNGTWHNPIYISPDFLPEFYFPVPEPAIMFLLGSGMAGLAWVRRRMNY